MPRDECASDVLVIGAGATGIRAAIAATEAGARVVVRPGDDESLEAHRLRATAAALIQIAARYLDTPATDMSPADSARVGAATRLTERALQIVTRTPPGLARNPIVYRKT